MWELSKISFILSQQVLGFFHLWPVIFLEAVQVASKHSLRDMHLSPLA